MPLEPSTSVISAIEYCLRPLVWLCIHFGVDYRRLSEMLKGVFVSICEESFTIPGKPQTDSRISLMTGVHRKDVKRLRGVEPGERTISASQSLAANVISCWLGNADLCQPNREPLPLPRVGVAGQPNSFEQMVGTLTRDIRAAVVLEELVRVGVVHVDNDDLVHLDVAVLIPDKSIDEKAYFFSQTVHDHISASGHNLAGNRPPFLDRFVWHHDLSEADAARLALAAEKAAMRALKTINEEAVALKAASAGDSVGKKLRIHFGTFFFSEPETGKPHEKDSKGN